MDNLELKIDGYPVKKANSVVLANPYTAVTWRATMHVHKEISFELCNFDTLRRTIAQWFQDYALDAHLHCITRVEVLYEIKVPVDLTDWTRLGYQDVNELMTVKTNVK